MRFGKGEAAPLVEVKLGPPLITPQVIAPQSNLDQLIAIPPFLLLTQAWDKYLATSRGSEALFNMIDANKTGVIGPTEISDWMTKVNRQGVNPAAWEKLERMSDDDALGLEEFRSWLIDATKLPNCNDTSVSPLVEQCDTKPVKAYSLNESTMSQSLRKMQYAVRVRCKQVTNPTPTAAPPLARLPLPPPPLTLSVPNSRARL